MYRKTGRMKTVDQRNNFISLAIVDYLQSVSRISPISLWVRGPILLAGLTSAFPFKTREQLEVAHADGFELMI